MAWTTKLGAAAAVLLSGSLSWAGGLTEPVALKVGEAKINAEVGHAAPFVCDWDGDGRQDLLVGQMGRGHLRIYRNAGTAGAPTFDSFELFKVGESEGTVPTG